MERRSDGPRLIDDMVADLGGPRTASFLEKVERVIDFDALAPALVRRHRHALRQLRPQRLVLAFEVLSVAH